MNGFLLFLCPDTGRKEGTQKVGGEQVGPQPHDAGHGLPAAGVTLGVHLLLVDVVSIQKILRQSDGLLC